MVPGEDEAGTRRSGLVLQAWQIVGLEREARDDDGDVLESRIVVANIGRMRRAARGGCAELDRLFVQSEWKRTGCAG